MSLNIQKDAKVYRLNEEYIITKIIDFKTVFAKNTTTYETIRLNIEDLSSKPIGTLETNICEDLSQIPKHKLEEAQQRYEAIKPILSSRSRKAVEARAKELKISPTTLYNWIRSYESTGQLSSLAALKIKGGKDQSRLQKEQDEIIALAIEEYYLKRLKPTIQRTYELVISKCRNSDIEAPSLSSVRRRINALSERLVLKRREGNKAIEQFDINKGKYPDGLYPLHVLQIDHTQADVILVDDEHRQELGRPWITVAIDVYSRMVAGFYVSFESPGYFGTGQTLLCAMLPKEKLKKKYDFTAEWPVWGIPNMIAMDNAKEFRGIDLQHVCNEYGINIVWRPTGKAKYGAHIERLMGTFSKHIHTLDGTTFSNFRKKRDYDSQKNATMTLYEFEKWFAILIADVYHQSIHSEIEMSPLQKYEEGIFGTKNQPPRGLPRRIEDEQFLYVNLLPKEERTIQKYGIQIDTINYYSEVLNAWIDVFDTVRGKKIKKQFLVRRDPRDISQIWFFDPTMKKYYLIPYRNPRFPKVSIWEFRAAQKYLKNQKNKEYREDEIFEALEKLREIAFEAKNKTKQQRKNIDRISKLRDRLNQNHYTSTSGTVVPESEKLSVEEAGNVWFEIEDITPFSGIEDKKLKE